MEPGTNGRNIALDFVKGIAALLVCYQHACVNMRGEIVDYLLAMARIAVPLFIMVTGYLYSDVVARGNEKKQIARFIKIGGQIVVFYFVIELVFKVSANQGADYLKSVVNPTAVKNFLLFNDPVPGDHSWYIWAMTYVLVILQAVPGIYKNKMVRDLIMFVSIMLQIGISKYSFVFTSQEPSALLYRNFLVPVIGYFFMGMFLRDHNRKEKWPNQVSVILLILTLIGLLGEKTILMKAGLDRESGTFFMASVLAVLVFVLTLQMNPTQGITNGIAKFGRKYSLYFYILHPVFVRVKVRLFTGEGIQQWMGLLFVYAASMIAALLLSKVHNRIGRKCR